MSDPWQLFKADPSRQETLKILWPALYDCLAQLDEAGPPRVIRCAVHPDTPIGGAAWKARPHAVARLVDEFGPPACRGCVNRTYAPGHPGWPLKRERKVSAR